MSSDYEQRQLVAAKRRRIHQEGIPDEVDRICAYRSSAGLLMGCDSLAICHGVCNGLETDEFQRRYPTAKIIGTDLNPYAIRNSESYRGVCPIIQWDFSKPNPEWVGKMDFLYSNSVMSINDPHVTFATWMEQLKPHGLAFLKWKLRDAKGGLDSTFHCDLHEFIDILSQHGEVVDLLYLGKSPRMDVHYVIVVARQRRSKS